MSLFKKRTAKSAPAPEQSGERRQLTVLFYDIVGSTSLIDGDDPEVLRAALELIHVAAQDAMAAHGGTVEQVMGDGGMAYFGYPVANEDAALCAVSAALELLEARQEIAAAPDIRIGIATSVVVLSDDPKALASGRLGAVGVAPNLAARLEAACPVNEIMVGQATYALTQRAVEYAPVDGLSLKGFPDVTRAWRAVSLRPIASRFQRDRAGSGAFTGRKAEMAALGEAWTATVAGSGTALLIEGDPGIGKSRLISEVCAIAEAKGRVVMLQCQPRTQGDALFSIIGMYDRAYDAATDPELADAAVRTAERLGALEEDETLGADARRAAILEAVMDELLALARKKPLLLVAEDLHWADEVTLAVLEGLGMSAWQSPIMIVGTSRSEPGLGLLREVFRQIPLSPITSEQAEALVTVTATLELTQRTRDWIAQRADGNPLFVTELTAFACETVAGGGDLSDLTGANVGSLSDLLAARLDSSGVAKRTAQLASVLGREYAYDLLSRLSAARYSTQELDADLQRLVDHGLNDLIQNGRSYAFRHALVRDAAYDSQLRSVRQALHGKIVDIVDAEPALADSVPDILLAEHCLAAERPERGAGLLLQVAEDAISRSALRAPMAMLRRVLSLVEALPQTKARDVLELRSIILLGPLVTLLEGPRASASLYERGQTLYFDLPEETRAEFFPVLWGWWFTAGDLIEQSRRSEVLIRDVKPEADPESRLQALHCGWASLFDGGNHDRCLAAITDGLALYDPEVGQRSRYRYGHDAQVCGLGERALSGWLTGQLELSAEAVAACEACADATAHLASQLHGLDIASQVAFFNQDLPQIDRILSKMARLSDADAVPAIAAKRQIFQGWMAARAGDAGQIEAVSQGLAALQGFGVLEDVPFYADIAADVTAASGAVEAALGPLGDAIEEAKATGLTFWLPELLRRKAILAPHSAVSALDQGFEIAQAQNAQMLALRNIGTRLDLGLPIPPEHAEHMRAKMRAISECALRDKVSNALDP